jgi:hypothetical protein
MHGCAACCSGVGDGPVGHLEQKRRAPPLPSARHVVRAQSIAHCACCGVQRPFPAECRATFRYDVLRECLCTWQKCHHSLERMHCALHWRPQALALNPFRFELRAETVAQHVVTTVTLVRSACGSLCPLSVLSQLGFHITWIRDKMPAFAASSMTSRGRAPCVARPCAVRIRR